MDELVISIVGLLITTITSIASLAYWLGKKFREIDLRFRNIELRIEKIEKRLDSVENKLLGLENRVNNIERQLNSVARATRDQLEFFSEFLGFRGILTDHDVAFVKSELNRLSTRVNPLTEEELKRIRELVKKDELTLEEATELRDLARKFVDEYGSEPGAWKLLMYASIMRGIAMRKLGEKKSSEK